MSEKLKLSRFGVIGGGQLGKMIAIAAANLGCKTIICATDANSPASQVSSKVVISDFTTLNGFDEFLSSVDVAVVEFENINVEFVRSLSKHIKVYPSAEVLSIASDRIYEKEFVRNLGLPTVPFKKVLSLQDLKNAFIESGKAPSVLKTCVSGYDGHGQHRINCESDIDFLPFQDLPRGYVLEDKIDLYKELSCVAAVSEGGEIEFFPVAENVHNDGILHTSSVPASLDAELQDYIYEISTKIIKNLHVSGLLAIEYFLDRQGSLFFNEMAPRPHNSCHWSTDACNVSQFEQLVRVALGLPLKKVKLLHPCKMKNFLGDEVLNWREYMSSDKNNVTIYGKNEVRKKRKMGHVNITDY